MKTVSSCFLVLMFTALAAVVTSCSDEEVDGEGVLGDGTTLRLQLRAAGRGEASPVRTRATWIDGNATDDEMMNLWTVVVTNSSTGSVVRCIACRPQAGTSDQEIDEVGRLDRGNYTVYSFANISVQNVCSLLGLTAPATVPTIDSTPTDIDVTGTVTNANLKTATINGNGFDPTADDNGFGEKGIPMSNVQTISAEDREKDLIVVRMLAKMEVQVYNDGATDATIESISLTDITANGTNNLLLLPRWTTATGRDEMPVTQHMDLQPNLGTAATKGNMTYTTPTASRLVTATGHRTSGEGQTPVTFTFYVNESVAPIDNTSATTGNGSGLFYLSLGIKTGAGEDVVYSHALINQQGKTETDDGAWHYIARNDYRVIPVVLTDWLLRIEPLAFVPIAGYPAVLLSSDAQKATFSTGGPIILQPFVKKRSEANWRDFSDKEVELVSIHWTNSDGDDQSGTEKILETPLAYDKKSKCIYGVLNNSLAAGLYKTAVTITVKLGPTDPAVGPQYTYSFTCDVILQKTS